VTDLARSNSGSGSGVLTLPVQSRIYVNGSVDLANSNAAGPSRASCKAERSSDGTNPPVFDVSPPVLADLHAVEGDSTVDPILYVPLTVTGSLLLDPGTYNVGIVCTGSGTLLVNNAAMNVLAVPASS
jgi:hypothetical protein